MQEKQTTALPEKGRALVELKDISVSFATAEGTEIHAVSRVDLTVRKGEIFGIVGPSGAGKSTLARVVNLLQAPTAGHVLVDGQDITGLQGKQLEALRQKIGMIFQHFNLISGSTVEKNISFNLLAAGWKKEDIPGRVKELLDLVGLSDKLHAYPSQLSGGQKQRVAIARALANNPELLLCDEATSALDPETTEGIVSILRSINRKMGLTIMFITHQMEVAKKLFDRIAVMDHGHIIEVNDTYSLFTSPRQTVTQKMVARVIDIEVPDELAIPADGQLFKLTYVGEKAFDPVIATVAQRYSISLSIVHGKIEYIDGKPFGILVVCLTGAPDARSQALIYLKENTSSVELLTKEQSNA
jgi:D-methionine transport system ATP-binding protein